MDAPQGTGEAEAPVGITRDGAPVSVPGPPPFY